MGKDDRTDPLSSRGDNLDREMVRLFGWLPSRSFRQRLIRFARSVRTSNVGDLIQLVMCEASRECHALWVHRNFGCHPGDGYPSAKPSPAEFHLWETVILRSLDRERQRWHREATRTTIHNLEFLPSGGSETDPALQAMQAEAVRLVQSFVASHFEADDQVLFEARFEQGLEFAQIAAIFGHKYSEPVLRQRASRMRKTLRATLGQVLE